MTGAKKDLYQMHERVGFRAIAVAELTRRERKRAQEGLMLLTRKKSGDIKGRLSTMAKIQGVGLAGKIKAVLQCLTKVLCLPVPLMRFKSETL